MVEAWSKRGPLWRAGVHTEVAVTSAAGIFDSPIIIDFIF